MSDTEPTDIQETLTHDPSTSLPEPAVGKPTKKKKPRKRGKKPTALPSLAAAEPHLLWKTRHTATLGRHAVAKQSIPPGQRVLVEEAVAAVPQFRSLEPEQDVPNAFCSAECYQTSLEYQPEMAAIFDALPEIASQTHSSVELLNLIVKLHDLKHGVRGAARGENGEAVGGQIWWMREDCTDAAMKGEWNDIRGLARHWERMGEEWKQSVTEACRCIRDKLKEVSHYEEVSLSDLKELAATVNTNSHGFRSLGAENTDLALGLFPALSMFNHSCDPNCCFTATGRCMTVRALREIEAGEQLTVSYINLMEPRWLRHQLLLESRFFACSCHRCSEDVTVSTDKLLEGVQCPVAKCSGLLIGSWSDEKQDATWSCLDCQSSFISANPPHNYQHPVIQEDHGHEHHHHHDGQCCHGHHHHDDPTEQEELPVLEEWVQQKCSKNEKPEGFDPGAILMLAQESLARAMQAYSERNLAKAIHLLEHHVKTFEVALNPYHVCVFDALTPLLNCYRSVEDTNSSLQICQRTLQSFDKVLSACSMEQANFQKILGELYQQKMYISQNTTQSAVVTKLMKKQAQEAFRRCLAIRQICVGPNHASSLEALSALKAL